MSGIDSNTQELVRLYGIQQYWYSLKDFELPASVCITLEELKTRWPSMTEEFISTHMGYGSKELPIAGLINLFDDGKTFQCKSINGFWRVYLLIPESHPDYIKDYPHSYQCFAAQYKIKDFVLPRSAIEKYEKAHPEMLRKIVCTADTPSNDEAMQNLIAALESVPAGLLVQNRKQFLAAILSQAGMKAETAYMLLTGKNDIALNGMQTSVRRWREAGKEILGFPEKK